MQLRRKVRIDYNPVPKSRRRVRKLSQESAKRSPDCADLGAEVFVNSCEHQPMSSEDPNSPPSDTVSEVLGEHETAMGEVKTVELYDLCGLEKEICSDVSSKGEVAFVPESLDPAALNVQ